LNSNISSTTEVYNTTIKSGNRTTDKYNITTENGNLTTVQVGGSTAEPGLVTLSGNNIWNSFVGFVENVANAAAGGSNTTDGSTEQPDTTTDYWIQIQPTDRPERRPIGTYYKTYLALHYLVRLLGFLIFLAAAIIVVKAVAGGGGLLPATARVPPPPPPAALYDAPEDKWATPPPTAPIIV